MEGVDKDDPESLSWAAPAGAVKLGGLSLRPELAVLNVQVVETGPGSGRALFKARTCSLVSRVADIVAGEGHAGLLWCA